MNLGKLGLLVFFKSIKGRGGEKRYEKPTKHGKEP
jgi:hypothetical protein